MTYSKRTREFDHLQYIPVLQRMYDENSVEEIKEYAAFSQIERFRKELDTLHAFGLHKKMDITPEPSRDEQTAARKFSDGKVDAIFSVSNAKIKETYRDEQNKVRYRRKIKHAFIQSTVVKSNRALSYDAENPPHCMNCRANMQAEGENYYCPYCRTHYQAEAYRYMLTRFFIEEVFPHFSYVWLFVIPVVFLAVLQINGTISEQQLEHFSFYFSYVAGTVLTFLLFFSLAKGFKAFLRHRSIQKNIRRHDPHFSVEIFTQRLNDQLILHPDILLSDKERGQTFRSLICRNILSLQLFRYERQGDLEIIQCRGKVDALFLQAKSRRVRLQDKHKKFTVRMARVYGTQTPLHYLPDQFTCQHCGSHQATERVGMQVCSYCRTERPLESIDWVLLF